VHVAFSVRPSEYFYVNTRDEVDAAYRVLAGVHQQLFNAGVNVYASSGVSDGRGSFGYIVYVREDQFQRAVEALEL